MGRRGARSKTGREFGELAVVRSAEDEVSRLRQRTGLAFDPILPAIRVALTSLAPLQLRGRAKALRNVRVIDKCATSFGVLLPVAGAVEHGLFEQSLVAQVGGVVKRLNKLASVGVDGAIPCGAAGLEVGEGRGEGGFSGHGIGS